MNETTLKAAKMRRNYQNCTMIGRRCSFLMTLLSIGLILGITAIGFTFHFHEMETIAVRINRIERIIKDLRAAKNIDKIRQANIQRVMKLISHYNSSMPANVKYKIASEIYEMSLKYTNLDVNLICATITHESAGTWDPKVTSEAGAMGLMQIIPSTGVFLAHYEDINWTSPEDVLYNPILNIRMGCRHLSTLIDLYGVDGGLAAYNGGEKRAAMWLAHNKAAGILWEETQTYIPAVLKLYQQFRD
ncbi:MAG TPA: lytic transglycosylase domain-containing protein [Bacteroidetes bacterium]|nr:lytic transglycosylase domain-containing protein [Bacteroidota bacterium]